MNFESLPNELFLDLFDYFDGTDLFHAFDGLNSRFNHLLYQQYRTFRFDFRSVSKWQFVVVCEKYFPRIADRVVALSFSDLDDIPEQIDLFFSSIPSIDLFINLQSISLHGVRVTEAVRAMMAQWHHLNYLRHFKCRLARHSSHREHSQILIDHLWNLPQLVHCEMRIPSLSELPGCSISQVSMSIKRLSWNETTISLSKLNRLLDCTPNLTHLTISVKFLRNDAILILLPKMISFTFHGTVLENPLELIHLLQKIPNLRSLQMHLSTCVIQGDQWQELIVNYLPKLTKFHLRMTEDIHENDNVLEKMKEYTDSFRNAFWIDVHQWFVRCFLSNNQIYLCTLPNTFSSIVLSSLNFFDSTDVNDSLQKFCDETTKMTVGKLVDPLQLATMSFTNLEDLQMRIPLHDQFWSIVPNLTRLRSLTVHVDMDIPQSLFEDLFHRTPHLQQLTTHINKVSFREMLSAKSITPSLRQLDIQYHLSYFNEEDCLAFTRSPLVTHCETLSIHVENGESIVIIANNISRLRLLSIFYQDIKPLDYATANKDVFVHWLKERLPSTCSITASRSYFNNFRIWM